MAEGAQRFIKIVNKSPEQLYNPTAPFFKEIKSELKNLYDFCKREEIQSNSSSSLPQLVIENFENEQIWQQLELQNNSLLENAIIKVSNLLLKTDFAFKTKSTGIEISNEALSEVSDDALHEESEESLSEVSSTNYSQDDESNCEVKENKDSSKSGGFKEHSTEKGIFKGKSDVEDEFFKLHEMEEFLNREEERQNPDSGNEQESDGESRESIDLFQDSDVSDEDNDKLAKYKEFFKSNEERKPDRNKYLEEYDHEEDVDVEQSSLELRQSRLKIKIDEIEKNAVSEKQWQLQGEIKGDSRPQNSLLEVIVDYDRTTRSAPIITGQTTLQLEDIIRQRIKDKAFDSVERKKKLVETPFEYKKKLTLDQEKSKASLAQIYEKEFLEQKAALDQGNDEAEDKEPDSHKQIKTMIDQLFHQLDGLTNFYYTPTPAVPELKIVSNVPAIHMEEVAPIAISEAALLAPEEIKSKPQTENLGKNERTSTDKNRERRKKKLKQKYHAKVKEKEENLLKKNKSGKNSRENGKLSKKVTKMGNVDQMVENSGSNGHKSSTSFFMQLQEQVQSQIKSQSNPKRKKVKNIYDAKKLKL